MSSTLLHDPCNCSCAHETRVSLWESESALPVELQEIRITVFCVVNMNASDHDAEQTMNHTCSCGSDQRNRSHVELPSAPLRMGDLEILGSSQGLGGCEHFHAQVPLK
jgi:hypothetical protein